MLVTINGVITTITSTSKVWYNQLIKFTAPAGITNITFVFPTGDLSCGVMLDDVEMHPSSERYVWIEGALDYSARPDCKARYARFYGGPKETAAVALAQRGNMLYTPNEENNILPCISTTRTLAYVIVNAKSTFSVADTKLGYSNQNSIAIAACANLIYTKDASIAKWKIKNVGGAVFFYIRYRSATQMDCFGSDYQLDFNSPSSHNFYQQNVSSDEDDPNPASNYYPNCPSKQHTDRWRTYNMHVQNGVLINDASHANGQLPGSCYLLSLKGEPGGVWGTVNSPMECKTLCKPYWPSDFVYFIGPDMSCYCQDPQNDYNLYPLALTRPDVCNKPCFNPASGELTEGTCGGYDSDNMHR